MSNLPKFTQKMSKSGELGFWKSREGGSMFYGEHHHSIDTKGRLTIPAKIRQELGDECILTRGTGDCLNIFSLKEFKVMEKRINDKDDQSKQYLDYKRGFFSTVQLCTYDKQGRILINQNLRDRANLMKEVVIVGLSEKLEIWDKETWETKSDIDNDTYAELAAEILGKGIDR